MKKVILVLCVVALLVSAATAAMAAESYWVVKFKTGVYGVNETDNLYSNYGAVTVGASATPSTTNATNPASNAANISAKTGAAYYGTQRLDSDNGAPYSFTLALAVGSLYPNSTGEDGVYISAYAPDKYLGTTGRAMPSNYVVTVQNYDKTVTYATWTYDQLAMEDPTNAAGIGKIGFYYTPTAQTDAWAGVTTSDMFTVTVGPAVPEPGSLLALGSGLIGFVGFAIRRRRA